MVSNKNRTTQRHKAECNIYKKNHNTLWWYFETCHATNRYQTRIPHCLWLKHVQNRIEPPLSPPQQHPASPSTIPTTNCAWAWHFLTQLFIAASATDAYTALDRPLEVMPVLSKTSTFGRAQATGHPKHTKKQVGKRTQMCRDLWLEKNMFPEPIKHFKGWRSQKPWSQQGCFSGSYDLQGMKWLWTKWKSLGKLRRNHPLTHVLWYGPWQLPDESGMSHPLRNGCVPHVDTRHYHLHLSLRQYELSISRTSPISIEILQGTFFTNKGHTL